MSHGCFSNVFLKISLHSLIAQLKVKGLDTKLWFSFLNEAKHCIEQVLYIVLHDVSNACSSEMPPFAIINSFVTSLKKKQKNKCLKIIFISALTTKPQPM